MYQEALLQGRTGVVMRALSMIDVALWIGMRGRPASPSTGSKARLSP